MGKYVAIIGGLVAIALGLWLLIANPYQFWQAFVTLVKGCIPPLLVFGGLIAIIAGVSSIKDAARTKKLEAETKEEEKKQTA